MVSALPLSGELGELQDHEGKLCGAPWMEEMIIFTVPASRKVKTLCLLGVTVRGLHYSWKQESHQGSGAAVG